MYPLNPLYVISASFFSAKIAVASISNV